MKLTVDRKAFRNALHLAAHVRDKGGANQITASVVLRADKKRLDVQATDLTVDMTAKVDAKIEDKGAVCVDHQLLTKIVDTASGDVLELDIYATMLVVRCDQAKFRVPMLNLEHAPKVHGKEGAKFFDESAATLRALFDAVAFACCDDATRPQLSGVWLHGDGELLRAVATDGHRLASHALPSKLKLDPIIVPSRAVGAFRHLLRDAEWASVAVLPSRVLMIVDDVMITAAPVDMKYPDWQAVVPKPGATFATVNVRTLRSALKRARLLVGDQGMHVQAANGKLMLDVEREAGQFSEVMPIEFDGEFVTGANPKYLDEWLDQVDGDTAHITVGDPLAPIRLEDGTGRLGVVMPMRV